MSEALAIPATTLVLKLLIEKRLAIAYGADLTAPTVSTVPPPQRVAAAHAVGAPPPAEGAALHLFLHHVTPNPAWRNMYEPHIGSDGTRRGPAPVALDLSYLVAAAGASLERETLLGVAISALTRNAIVPRAMITALLGGVSATTPPVTVLDLVPKAPLADPVHQLESLSIAQSPIDVDMSTKLWSALQSPLRPSAYFTVTTVFLDVEETFPAAIGVDKLRVGLWPDSRPRKDVPADNRAETVKPLP
jgi:Pvc16 N-terminal domain